MSNCHPLSTFHLFHTIVLLLFISHYYPLTNQLFPITSHYPIIIHKIDHLLSIIIISHYSHPLSLLSTNRFPIIIIENQSCSTKKKLLDLQQQRRILLRRCHQRRLRKFLVRRFLRPVWTPGAMMWPGNFREPWKICEKIWRNLEENMSMDWFKGKSTGNHRLYH
jgi:hypothetical protein